MWLHMFKNQKDVYYITGRVAFSHPVHSLLKFFCHDKYGFMSNKDSQKIQTNYGIIAIAVEVGVYWEIVFV